MGTPVAIGLIHCFRKKMRITITKSTMNTTLKTAAEVAKAKSPRSILGDVLSIMPVASIAYPGAQLTVTPSIYNRCMLD